MLGRSRLPPPTEVPVEEQTEGEPRLVLVLGRSELEHGASDGHDRRGRGSSARSPSGYGGDLSLPQDVEPQGGAPVQVEGLQVVEVARRQFRQLDGLRHPLPGVPGRPDFEERLPVDEPAGSAPPPRRSAGSWRSVAWGSTSKAKNCCDTSVALVHMNPRRWPSVRRGASWWSAWRTRPSRRAATPACRDGALTLDLGHGVGLHGGRKRHGVGWRKRSRRRSVRCSGTRSAVVGCCSARASRRPRGGRSPGRARSRRVEDLAFGGRAERLREGVVRARADGAHGLDDPEGLAQRGAVLGGVDRPAVARSSRSR